MRNYVAELYKKVKDHNYETVTVDDMKHERKMFWTTAMHLSKSTCLFLLILAFLKSHRAEGTGCLNGLTPSPASTCVDKKTCVDVACGQHATCVNESGTFKCKCSVGFTFKTTKMDVCEDIDECNPGVCPKGKCVNIPGSYYCECYSGMRYDASGSCVDIDKCMVQPQICGGQSICINTEGSNYCICQYGFRLHKGSFVDVDECVEGQHACSPSETCINQVAGYQCNRSTGFLYHDSKRTWCEDVDECMADPQICKQHSTCLNTIGSYFCHCLPGFRIKKSIGASSLCVDINECVEDKPDCGYRGSCHNLVGSYWCQCSAGSTNYGNIGTKCVELSCDQYETWPGKTLPGLGSLLSQVRVNCLMLRNSSLSGPDGQPFGDVLLNVLINASDLVQLSLQEKNGLHGSSDVTSFLEIVEDLIRLIAPQLTENTTRIETNYTEAEILVNRNRTQPKGPVSLTTENAQLDTTWETVAGDENNYPGFAFVSLVSFKTVHSLNGESSQTQKLISNAVTVSTGNLNSTILHQPINLTFRHLLVAPFKMVSDCQLGDEDPDCVYWSEENGAWSRRGCNSVITNATHTLCSCNHLSTFSLLKGLQQEKGEGQLPKVMWAGILVALTCVFLSLITALLCRFASKRRHRGRSNLDVKFFRK